MISYYLNNKKLETINENVMMTFPPTPVGEFNQLVLEVKNDLDRGISLEPFVKDPELEVTSYPKILNKQERGEVILTFRPSARRLEPLDTEWGFRVLIG